MIPVLCGPTASGKTALAAELFGDGRYEAVSADSMQVYRGMDIGTAKPGPALLARLPHHLLDVVDPDGVFSAGEFVRAAETAFLDIESRGRRPLVVGGTGLYLRALCGGLCAAPARDDRLRETLLAEERAEPGSLFRRLAELDPESAARLAPADHVRIVRALEVRRLTGRTLPDLQRENRGAGEGAGHRFRVAAVIRDRAELAARIEKRVAEMFEQGLLDEVRALAARGHDPLAAAPQAIGYRAAAACLAGTLTPGAARAAVVAETRAYAKRQILLFKKLPGLVWFHAEDRAGLAEYFAAVA